MTYARGERSWALSTCREAVAKTTRGHANFEGRRIFRSESSPLSAVPRSKLEGPQICLQHESMTMLRVANIFRLRGCFLCQNC
jgi:hypothetical protein